MDKKWLPTDEELDGAFFDYAGRGIAPGEIYIITTAKKIAERLQRPCAEHPSDYIPLDGKKIYADKRINCPECWDSLLKEIGES